MKNIQIGILLIAVLLIGVVLGYANGYKIGYNNCADIVNAKAYNLYKELANNPYDIFGIGDILGKEIYDYIYMRHI